MGITAMKLLHPFFYLSPIAWFICQALLIFQAKNGSCQINVQAEPSTKGPWLTLKKHPFIT